MNHYNSPESALADLQKRGYVFDMSLQGNCIQCEEAFTTLLPGEYSVAEVYRFHDQQKFMQPTVVYAIDSRKGIRGILLDINATTELELVQAAILCN